MQWPRDKNDNTNDHINYLKQTKQKRLLYLFKFIHVIVQLSWDVELLRPNETSLSPGQKFYSAKMWSQFHIHFIQYTEVATFEAVK